MAAHQPRRSASPAVERADCGVPVAALDQVELLTQSWPVQPGPPDGSQRRTLSAATCALHPEPVAVGVARRFTRTTLAAWQLDRLADDVSVVVSELVTNALRHALTVGPDDHTDPPGEPTPAVDGHRPPPWVQLVLLGAGDQLLCTVRDPSDLPPQRIPADHVAHTGRGLHLVDSITLAWGWAPVHPAGKVVWALFPIPVHRPA